MLKSFNFEESKKFLQLTKKAIVDNLSLEDSHPEIHNLDEIYTFPPFEIHLNDNNFNTESEVEGDFSGMIGGLIFIQTESEAVEMIEINKLIGCTTIEFNDEI